MVLPTEPEEESDEDDPNNSGSHVNDALNLPDMDGNVLVNVGHPEDEEDVFLAPQLAAYVKPHQVCLPIAIQTALLFFWLVVMRDG